MTPNPSGGGWNDDTILQLLPSGHCYANRLSRVRVGEGFSFRNAPHFVNFLVPAALDAAYETEALIDHLVTHPNTAPFIAHRLIQRFTTSNPSPRYVRAVADAFTTGTYEGVVYGDHSGYGSLGDTGATTCWSLWALNLFKSMPNQVNP